MRELVPLPDPVPPATEVRATVLSSSLQAVRERDLQDAYFERLDEAHHDPIRGIVPQSWVPMALALAHYDVMNQLLGPEEAKAIGRKVAERVHHGYLGTLIRGLRASGVVTPLKLLTRFDSAVERMVRGGGAAAWEVGPKDAMVELHAIPMANNAYFRAGLEGIAESSLGLVARKVFAHSHVIGPDATRIRISWV